MFLLYKQYTFIVKKTNLKYANEQKGEGRH